MPRKAASFDEKLETLLSDATVEQLRRAFELSRFALTMKTTSSHPRLTQTRPKKSDITITNKETA